MNDSRQMTNDKWQMTLVTMAKEIVFRASWIIALILIVSSCSVKKDAANIKTLSVNHIIREVENNRFDFDNLEAKFDVNIENNMGLKGTLRMQNDSVIWISLSIKLGVEVARIMITEDSLKIINRAKKTYLSTNIEDFDSIVENPLRFVQGLLVGNDNQIKDDKYQVEIVEHKYRLKTKFEFKSEKDELITKNIYVVPETFKISKYEINTIFLIKDKYDDILSQSLSSLSYGDFQNINGKLIPSKIIFEDSSLIGTIEINYTDIKIGEKLEFPFNISKKYKRISSW